MHEIDALQEQSDDENVLSECSECGGDKKHFMHNCGTAHDEFYGCPTCDDNCGSCS